MADQPALAPASRQLAAIEEFVAVADRLGVPVWLRGGWAVDFSVGRVTREHADIDWFAPADQAENLVGELIRLGYARSGDAPDEQQTDLIRGEIELGVAWLAFDERGQAVVGGGPWAGAPWPSGMLDGPRCAIGHVSARVISVDAQITIKELTPIWKPHLPRRAKDLDDIAVLRGHAEP